ncbi:hypothetical protein BFF47_23445 [Shigella sp. FC1764]|nr:hypothetical protein ABE81_10770 [Shigella boydii]ODG84828.1 hypothetical protein BFF48_22785 [Shigella sp. FC1882]ODG85346.1 hypothetical protein BFF47_23445 [Shigella sp. FC1764]ODJ31626.1 hypothetical protein BFR12_23085 [Shigella sp. FC2833]OEG29350.1 hypothetical protein BHQ32_23620 [Shigella sp. FC2117]OEG29976.1 hypothetical protein BHQ35_23250 [Shigella sp. FC2175]OEG30570.1 hypothetical protein BHQ33_22865 [Shigella sp. FC2125]OEG42276.1 hypothetical protein BHQ38_23340 [Shigella
MLEDTTIHNAITDKALASYFRSSGNLLEEESAVLGQAVTNLMWICPYISRHLLSLNPLQARSRRYSRGER